MGTSSQSEASVVVGMEVDLVAGSALLFNLDVDDEGIVSDQGYRWG